MAYPFVKSSVDLGRASGPRRAMAWHMAEGGGTVGYLSRQNPNGVSVHFVIEYSGRIVQMLELSHMHTSIRVTAIRASDDPPYEWQGEQVRYGATAAKTVLGDWWRNPNNATIGVEVEGFAKAGPNAMQRGAIGRLWQDMRGRYPDLRNLCHRDFADYKACPGRKFPWDVTSGHGPSSERAVAAIAVTSIGTTFAYIVRIADKAVTYGPNEGERGSIGPKSDGSPWVGNALGVYGLDGADGRRVFLLTSGGDPVYVAEADVSATKWERSATEPQPTPEPHVVTLTVDGKTVYSEELP